MKFSLPNLRLGILFNTAWLFSERLLQMFVALVLTTLIARHLGPSDFGKFSLATAFVALFMTGATLSLDGLIVRDTAKDPVQANSILGSAFAIRFVAGSLAWLSALLVYPFVFPNIENGYLLLFIIGSSLATQPFQVIDLWFQSQSKAYLGVSARIAALFLSASIKTTMLICEAPVLYFAIAQAAESILTAGTLFIAYQKNNCLGKWSATQHQIKSLVRNGWPLALAGIGITIYMKIDQLAVGSMLGQEALGIYAATAPIVQGLAVLPTAFSAIVFPNMVKLRHKNQTLYKRRSAELVRYSAVASLITCIAISLTSPLIIAALYGKKYEAAAPLLAILVFNSMFASVGTALGIFSLNESLQKISLYATAAAAFSAPILSYILIGALGLTGAAYAAISSNAIAVVLVPLAISKEYRSLYKSAFLWK